MCGPTPTTIQKPNEASLPCSNVHKDNNKGTPKTESKYKYWPLHPLAVLTLLTLLPTEFYLNRGYTQWFHWTAVAYLLTGSAFLRRFLVVQGTGITLGWYSAIANDWYWNDKFCHVLYQNMPSTMTNVMLDSTSQTSVLLLDSWHALSVMGLSHILDTLGHPLLTLLFWRLHCRSGGSLRDLLSWNIVVSTYMLSRLWSLTHTLHNYGTTGWDGIFYVGHDVYILEDLNSWMAAYVAEGFFYVAIVLYKIFVEEQSTATTAMSTSTKTTTKRAKATGTVDAVKDTKPSMIPSESGVSMESM